MGVESAGDLTEFRGGGSFAEDPYYGRLLASRIEPVVLDSPPACQI